MGNLILTIVGLVISSYFINLICMGILGAMYSRIELAEIIGPTILEEYLVVLGIVTTIYILNIIRRK